MKIEGPAPVELQTTLPFTISLPHCSGRVPPEVRHQFNLSPEEIRQSTDLGTEELFGALPVKEVVRAEWSRLVVDLNRGPRRWDDRGVLARVDYFGRSIYHAAHVPSEEETRKRLERYYYPFHRQIHHALKGESYTILLDCHSLCSIGPPQAPDAGMGRKDITLGNNGNGEGEEKSPQGRLACPRRVMEVMKSALERFGFSVSVNSPYSGGFITRHYGGGLCKKGRGGAIQIEINQNLFLEPGKMILLPQKVEEVKERLRLSLIRAAEDL